MTANRRMAHKQRSWLPCGSGYTSVGKKSKAVPNLYDMHRDVQSTSAWSHVNCLWPLIIGLGTRLFVMHPVCLEGWRCGLTSGSVGNFSKFVQSLKLVVLNAMHACRLLSHTSLLWCERSATGGKSFLILVDETSTSAFYSAECTRLFGAELLPPVTVKFNRNPSRSLAWRNTHT